jgi:hypothetical protein
MAKRRASRRSVKGKVGAEKLTTHTRAFLAHSDAAPPDQDKRKQALDCIASAFDSIGVPNVDDPSDQIDWGSFKKDDCDDLADWIKNCLVGKGWVCPPLAAIFQFLREEGRVMTVSSLIDALIQVSHA